MAVDETLITLVGVGDVVPNREQAEAIFAHCAGIFQNADISFAQLETSLSTKTKTHEHLARLHTVHPRHISAFTQAGFHVLSYAGNHTMEDGYEAYSETVGLVRNAGIAIVGTGENLEAARQPVFLERKGTRVAFLAFCSILPPGCAATATSAGVAPLRARTEYRQVDFQPGTPPQIFSYCDEEDLEALVDAVHKAKGQADIVVLSMHYGVHFVEAMIAMYQQQAAYAAIDAGADLILGHHAHILKGIEVYKGRAIFHSLGNFAVDELVRRETSGPILGADGRRTYQSVEHYRDYFPRNPEPGWEKWPYHLHARYTMIAKAIIQDGTIRRVSYIPCYINQNRDPVPLQRSNPLWLKVFDYMQRISEHEGLPVQFAWDGDEVVVTG